MDANQTRCYDCGDVAVDTCPDCGKAFCQPCVERPDVACCCDEPMITRFERDQAVAQARTEAAKEHAALVRELAKGLPDKPELETLDVWASLESLAQAIEKGAK